MLRVGTANRGVVLLGHGGNLDRFSDCEREVRAMMYAPLPGQMNLPL